MKDVITSAPAKIILFGEHFVVHGTSALSTALDLRIYCGIHVFPSEVPIIKLSSPDIGIEYSRPSSTLKQYEDFFGSWNDQPQVFPQKLINSLMEDTKNCESIVSALILLIRIAGKAVLDQSIYIKVSSEFQPGIGLGSSAAYHVSLACALLKCFGNFNNPMKDPIQGTTRNWNDVFCPSDDLLDFTNRWAYIGEIFMHENPSGIDNSNSTFGGAIKFKKGADLQKISRIPQLRLLITNTKVSRSTKNLVVRVSNICAKLPHITDPILKSVENIVEDALLLFDKYSQIGLSENQQIEAHIKHLIDINHGLLCAMGVGHESLDRIVSSARKFGMSTKLTGAGGGGCAFTFLDSSIPIDKIELLKSELVEKYGYECFEAKIGSAGVLVHENWPL